MSNIISARVRFIDDGMEQDVLISDACSPDDLPAGYADEDIFFYGMPEGSIRKAFETGEACENEWTIVKIYADDDWDAGL